VSEPWREKLRERFRSVGLDRVREISRALGDEGSERGARRAWALEELHTLKGEAKLLNLMGIAQVAHAAEERLGRGGSEMLSAGAREAVQSALDVVAGVLREGFADEARMAAALEGALARLVARAEEAATATATAAVTDTATATAAVTDTATATAAAAATVTPTDAAQAPEADVRWLRIPAARVEELCDVVADLTTDLRRLITSIQEGAPQDRSALGAQPMREACALCLTKLEGVGSAAWALRMVPIEPMLLDMCRHARELAAAQGKLLRTRVRTSGAEVDRDLLDALWDPLLHVVRNAVDHGIEPPSARGAKPEAAMLSFDADQTAAEVALRIEDDGRGINPAEVRAAAASRGLIDPDVGLTVAEALDLIFRPDFSTRSSATDVSGRGVGLSVVRRTVESLGGTVSVASEVGRGTRFTLRVPASATKQRLLVLMCAGDLYAIPTKDVIEVRKGEPPRSEEAKGEVVRSLSEALGIEARAAEKEPWTVVLKAARSRFAVSAPLVLGERELVRRPADALVGATGVFVGSATLEDGRLVLVMSAPGLERMASRRATS
jgi:two-component system chemotaxis sensor kinase CheA